MGKKDKYSLRYGKTAKEIRQKWMFNHPNTVISKIQKIGKTSDGLEYYYHVFYHERVKDSKLAKTIRRIREKGGKYGRT